MGENTTEIFERLSRIEQGVARIDKRTEFSPSPRGASPRGARPSRGG